MTSLAKTFCASSSDPGEATTCRAFRRPSWAEPACDGNQSSIWEYESGEYVVRGYIRLRRGAIGLSGFHRPVTPCDAHPMANPEPSHRTVIRTKSPKLLRRGPVMSWALRMAVACCDESGANRPIGRAQVLLHRSRPGQGFLAKWGWNRAFLRMVSTGRAPRGP